MARFPVSPDLIGPWDALLAFLKALPREGRPQGIEAMVVAVTTARQQVVNLNNFLASMQDQMQSITTDLAALTESVAALEGDSTPGVLAPFAEEPTGTKNGVNAQFTLTVTPEPTTFILTLNGQLLFPNGSDYTLTGNVIIYVTGKIPESTDGHYAWGWA